MSVSNDGGDGSAGRRGELAIDYGPHEGVEGRRRDLLGRVAGHDQAQNLLHMQVYLLPRGALHDAEDAITG